MSEEGKSMGQAEKVRRLLREGARKMIETGVPVEDVAIGALHAAFDIAEHHAGPEQAAVEWLRTGADYLEGLIHRGAPRSHG